MNHADFLWGLRAAKEVWAAEKGQHLDGILFQIYIPVLEIIKDEYGEKDLIIPK